MECMCRNIGVLMESAGVESFLALALPSLSFIWLDVGVYFDSK